MARTVEAAEAIAGAGVLVRATVVDDVFSRGGRRVVERMMERGLTVRQVVERIRACPEARLHPEAPLSVLVNGSPLRDGAAEWDEPYGGAEPWRAVLELMIAPRPGIDPSTLILIGIAVVSAAASAWLISGITAPAATGSKDPEQRRFSFGRLSTDPVVGDVFPVPFGRLKRWGGKVISRSPSSISGQRDSQGNERVRILIDLGLGPVKSIGSRARGAGAFNKLGHRDLTGVYINDQPLVNFPSVRISGRFGTSGQRPMPGFRDTEIPREAGVGGVELVNTSGSERTGGSASGEAFTFTTVAAVDAVLIRVRFDRGLYSVSAGGQVNARRVKWRYRTRPTGGSYGAWTVVTVERADQSEVLTIERTDELNGGGAAAIHDVQVERVTPDADGATVVDHMVLTDIVEVVYDDNTYAGHAVVGLEVTASEELSTIPRVSFEVDGYDDCRVWDGSTTEEVDGITRPVLTRGWSSNPLDIALEVLTNAEWGMGESDENIYWESWMAERAYAAEPVPTASGGTRPRCACNIVLDEAKDDIDWLRAILNTAQCRPYQVGGKWGFVTDRPRAEPVEFFGDGDIARDADTEEGPGPMLLSFRRVDTSPDAGVPNQLICQFQAADLDGRDDVLKHPEDGELWLATETPLPRSFLLPGVTDREQVKSRLIYELDRQRGLSRTVAFTTTKKAVAVLPGERFDVACSVLGWGTASGRVAAGSELGAVKLDRTVVLSAGVEYELTIAHLDGTIEVGVVVGSSGEFEPGKAIEVVGLTAAPLEGASYSIGPSALSAKPFTCTKVAPAVDERLGPVWVVEGIEYDEEVYDQIPGNVDIPDYSDLGGLTTAPGPVLDLRGTTGSVNGIDQVGLSWRQTPDDAQRTGSFRVYRRSAGTSTWILVPQVIAGGGRRAAVIEIADRDAAFDFCVVAVSLLGSALSPYDPSVPIWSTVFGLSAPPPPPPTGFTATQVGDTYTLSWDAVDGAVGYQVLAGGDAGTGLPNDGAEDCLVLARPTDPELTGLLLPPGQACRFWVRSVGPSGRLSWTAATVNVATPATPSGKSILQTETFDLDATGTDDNTAWNVTASRLELVDPTDTDGGTWTSAVVDVGSGGSGRAITLRPMTANDADDPGLSVPTWPVPSINADQWGVVSGSGSTAVVGMVMPPWPDDEQTWLFEVRTSADNVTFTAWAAVAFGAALAPAGSWRYWQVRATMKRKTTPYRPALRGLVGVVTG